MVCEVLKIEVEAEEEENQKWVSFRQRVTFFTLNFLFALHGFPVPGQPLCWRLTLGTLRLFGLSFVNFYVAYRTYKLVSNREFTYDTFPLINAAVSACIANSVLIHCRQFGGFSERLFRVMASTPDVGTACAVRLVVFYSLFLTYVLTCTGLFPFSANHWFDAAVPEDTPPDFFHTAAMKPISHVLIFATCGGCVVSHLMLFCLVCCLLKEVLRRLCADLRREVTLELLRRSQERFIAAADLVQRADSLFSLFGFVGLGSVFARACSCIHFYLNMKSPFKDSWSFLMLQVTFDMVALTAVSCFAAGVPEASRRLPAAALAASALEPPRRTRFHAACLAFAKVVVSADLHLSAWRLFPFTRKVVPTVAGLTLSYVAVIVQMHHAASPRLLTFERPLIELVFRNVTINGTDAA